MKAAVGGRGLKQPSSVGDRSCSPKQAEQIIEGYATTEVFPLQRHGAACMTGTAAVNLTH